MNEIQCFFVFYLLVLVTFGTGIITKYVCTDDSVQLFENIKFDSQDTVVSLYMNHETDILLARWEVQNSTRESHIQQEYKEKVYFKGGSIWMQNINHWDEEKYFINTSYMKYEVEISVKVAPKRNCKPKIIHHEKMLIASLKVEDCGIPVASLQWLDHPGLSNTSEPMINLPPGNEAGTYYACIKGPALECAKISALSDYCSSYTIGGRISCDTTTNSETEGGSVMIGVLVMNIVIFVFMIAMTVVLIYSKCARYNSKNEQECEGQDEPLMETSERWKETFGKLKWENIMQYLTGDQQQDLRKHCERLNEVYPQLWQNHFGTLKWDNVMQLLNGDQLQGLRKHCEVLNGEYPQLWKSHLGKLNWENIMLLLNEDQQQGLQKHCDAEAEKIKDSQRSKMRRNLKVMKRTGRMSKDVYRFLCDNKPFDPNILE